MSQKSIVSHFSNQQEEVSPGSPSSAQLSWNRLLLLLLFFLWANILCPCRDVMEQVVCPRLRVTHPDLSPEPWLTLTPKSCFCSSNPHVGVFSSPVSTTQSWMWYRWFDGVVEWGVLSSWACQVPKEIHSFTFCSSFDGLAGQWSMGCCCFYSPPHRYKIK